MVEESRVKRVVAALEGLKGQVVEQKLTDDVVGQFTNKKD
jgi:hypothetical protein